jgi:diketogulonate reductase-like aldo/keto reductase
MNERSRPAPRLTRRETLGLLAAFAASPAAHAAASPVERAIPRTGERLPALGLGTWQVLDVPPRGADYDAALAAVQSLLEAGGRVIDSSPMYGSSEERVGDILAAIKPASRPFLATKIWTSGRGAGERQLADSHRFMRAKILDLVQVHNLQDLDTHLATLRAARDAGTVRYIGVTHYLASAHAELERVIRREKPDFLQVNYSIAEPEAGARLLPLARELGVAVLINRPFTKGAMIDRAAGHALPPVAAELGCRSAAQLFIKWVLGDLAVTVILAATRNPRHAAENLAAAAGRMPDDGQRKAIAGWFDSL